MDKEDAGGELLIKRKRRRWRTAVDPCLGVYLNPSSSSICVDTTSFGCKSTPLLELEVKEQSHAYTDHDTVQAIRSGALEQISCFNNTNSNQGIATVTVDDFLTNVITQPTKVYKKRTKRRVVNIGHTSGSINCTKRRHTSPSCERSESPFSSGSEKPRHPRRRRRRNTKGLAERMFQAAVLSHVDHDQIPELYHPSSHSRRPLPFVRDDCHDSNRNVFRKHRAPTLVDPRKTSPFRHATFSSPTSAFEDNYAVRKTRATNRRRFTTSRAQNTVRLRKKQAPVSMSDCLPLSFVPLVDLKDISNEQHRYPRSAKSGCSRQPTGPDSLRHSRLVCVSAHTSAVADTPIKASGPRSRSQKGITWNSGCPGSPVTAPAVDNQRPISEPPAVSSGNPHIITRCTGVETVTDEMSQTELNDDNRTYKKLASFLGGLLETARKATFNQDAATNTQSNSTGAQRRKRNRRHIPLFIGEPDPFYETSHPA